MEEKSVLIFFLDWAGAQQRAPAAPMRPGPRLRHLATAVIRQYDIDSFFFDVDMLIAFVVLCQLVYCEAVKGHTCIHCAK